MIAGYPRREKSGKELQCNDFQSIVTATCDGFFEFREGWPFGVILPDDPFGKSMSSCSADSKENIRQRRGREEEEEERRSKAKSKEEEAKGGECVTSLAHVPHGKP